MNLKSAIEKFLEHAEAVKHQSPKTIDNYTRYLSLFLEFAWNINVSIIDFDLIQKYSLFLHRRKNRYWEQISIKTQNYYLISLRSLLKYLAKRDIKTLSAEKVELAKVWNREVDFLTRDELERLFSSVDLSSKTWMRDLAILHCLYSTGLRVSELCCLDRNQVNLKTKEFVVRWKWNKLRIVFLSDQAVEIIDSYLKLRSDNFKPLFISQSNRGKNAWIIDDEKVRLSRDTVERIVQKFRFAAWILKKVTPHTLRHSFATWLLWNWADIRSVQEMLWHASITTTQVYTHVTNNRLREIHEKFHG